jgi:hypothetical protein
MATANGGIRRQGACMATMRLDLGISTGLSRRGNGRERDSKTAGQKGARAWHERLRPTVATSLRSILKSNGIRAGGCWCGFPLLFPRLVTSAAVGMDKQRGAMRARGVLPWCPSSASIQKAERRAQVGDDSRGPRVSGSRHNLHHGAGPRCAKGGAVGSLQVCWTGAMRRVVG